MIKNTIPSLEENKKYRGYHIIANTAAGRRRYMQWLVPYVIACPEIERYDIWVHTHNGADIEFFKQLAAAFPKINLIWQPNGVVKDISTINPFYQFCCEKDAIYIKLDDDIPWMEDDALKKMIDFRIDNPEHFLVSPLVINNAQCTYLLQVMGKIKLNAYYKSHADGKTLWVSGKFAADLHQWFIDNFLKTGKTEALHCGSHPTSMTRFSINNILWFGRDLAVLEGKIPGDDEEFLSCEYPTKLGKTNCFNGDAIISHFAFFTQREQLDKQNILQQYGEYLKEHWSQNELLKPIFDKVQEIVSYVDAHEAELMKIPSPYIKPAPPVYSMSIKDRIYAGMPVEIQKAWDAHKERSYVDNTQYIYDKRKGQ